MMFFLKKTSFFAESIEHFLQWLESFGGRTIHGRQSFFRGKEAFFTISTFHSREKLESIGDRESAWRWPNHRFGGQSGHKTIRGDRNNDDMTRNRHRKFAAGARPAGTRQKRKTDTQNASLWANLK